MISQSWIVGPGKGGETRQNIHTKSAGLTCLLCLQPARVAMYIANYLSVFLDDDMLQL